MYHSIVSKPTFITSTFNKLKRTTPIFAALTISTSMVQVNAVLPTLVEENSSPSLNTYQPDSASTLAVTNNNNTSSQTFQATTQPRSSSSYAQLSNSGTILIPATTPTTTAINNSITTSVSNPVATSVSNPVTTFVANPIDKPYVTNNPVTNSSVNTYEMNKKVMAYVVSMDANGQEQLIPVTSTTRVKSGDILEYQTKVTNTTPDHINAMTVSVTIPQGVELVGNIAPQSALVSADGSNFQYMPIRANINGIVKDLPMTYYKSVRWNVKELNLNETATVSYRARFK